MKKRKQKNGRQVAVNKCRNAGNIHVSNIRATAELEFRLFCILMLEFCVFMLRSNETCRSQKQWTKQKRHQNNRFC